MPLLGRVVALNYRELRSIMDHSSADRNRTWPEFERLERVSAPILVAQPPTTRGDEAFWHMPQWQYSVAKGEPETQYLTAPQRQSPSMFLMFIFILVRPMSSIGRSFWIASEKLSTRLNCYTAYLAKEDWVAMRRQSHHLAISFRSKVIIPLFTKKDLKSNVTQA